MVQHPVAAVPAGGQCRCQRVVAALLAEVAA